MLSKTKDINEGSPEDVDEMDIPDVLDLSLPISTLLKIGTKRAHVKAEHSDSAKALVQGTLGLAEYIRWLAVLWRIYRWVTILAWL